MNTGEKPRVATRSGQPRRQPAPAGRRSAEAAHDAQGFGPPICAYPEIDDRYTTVPGAPDRPAQEAAQPRMPAWLNRLSDDTRRPEPSYQKLVAQLAELEARQAERQRYSRTAAETARAQSRADDNARAHEDTPARNDASAHDEADAHPDAIDREESIPPVRAPSRTARNLSARPAYSAHPAYEYAQADAAWFDESAIEPAPPSLIRRIAIPAAFALGLLMCVGALAVMLLVPPTDRDVTLVAGVEAQSGAEPAELVAAPEPAVTVAAAEQVAAKAVATATPSAATEAVAAIKPPAVTIEPTVPRAGSSALAPSAAPSPPASTPESAAAASTAPSEGGVTVMVRRDPPADPGVAAAAPSESSTVQAATAPSAPRFAPVDADPQSLESAIPPEVSALASSQASDSAQTDDVQPLAFAPTSDTTDADTPAPAAKPDKPIAAEAPATSTARATTFVNMRAGPDNSDRVLTVVPAKATIEVFRCRAWCEVSYKGQRGWIYKGFVDRSG